MATLAYSSPVASAVVAAAGAVAGAVPPGSSSSVAGPSSPSHHHHYPPQLHQSSRQQHSSKVDSALNHSAGPVVIGGGGSRSGVQMPKSATNTSVGDTSSPTATVQADARKRALNQTQTSSICDSNNSGNSSSSSSKSSLGSTTPNYILINKLRIQEQANARAAAKAAATASKASPTTASSSLVSQLSYDHSSSSGNGHNSIGSRTRLLLRSAGNSVPPAAQSSSSAGHHHHHHHHHHYQHTSSVSQSPNRSSFSGAANGSSSRPVVTTQDWLNGGSNHRTGGGRGDAATASSVMRRPSTIANKVITVVNPNSSRPSSISSSPCTSLHDHHPHRTCQQSNLSGRVVATKTTSATSKESSPPRTATSKTGSSVRPSLSVKSISNSRTTVEQPKHQLPKQTSVEQPSKVQLQEKADDDELLVVVTTTTSTRESKDSETDSPKSELQKCDTTNDDTTGTASVDQPLPSNATTITSENQRFSGAVAAAESGSKSHQSPPVIKSRPICDNRTQPQSPSTKLNTRLSSTTATTGNLRRGQLLFRHSKGLAGGSGSGGSRSGRDNAPADIDILRLASANSRKVKRQQSATTATTITSAKANKVKNRSQSTKSPNSNLLAFIEKSSPELIFLLSESAKLSYHLCQFEAKLDYLEQIFCRKHSRDEGSQSSAEADKTNGQKSSSPEHQSSHKSSWSSVIKRTRNWIDGVRSKNLLLEKRPEKKGSKGTNRFEQKLVNKKRVAPHEHQTLKGDEVAVVVNENDSSSSVHSSEDELILLLDRIIKFSSNIVSRLNPGDQNDQPSNGDSAKAEEKLDSTENVITKCDSESTPDDTTSTVGSEKRKAMLKMKQLSADSDTLNNNSSSSSTKLSKDGDKDEAEKADQNDSIVLNETLSSMSAESTAKGRYEWLQSLPSNVKDLMRQLFPASPLNSTPENDNSNAAAKFERIYELNPELLKALIENVKTNARLVQLRREFDRLMCSHLKAIGHEVKGNGGKAKKSSSSSAQSKKSSTPAKQKKADDDDSVFEKSPNRECATKFTNAGANKWKQSGQQTTTLVNCCCQQQTEQLHSNESGKSTSNPNCHCNHNSATASQQHHLMVSDGDSGGEFTATSVTNEFAQTNTTTTTATKLTPNSNCSRSNTDDELSSLLNQIAVCSAKIIEQQQQSTGSNSSTGLGAGVTGVASCSSNNSNSTSSSSGCCCSSASLMDGSGSAGVVGNGKCPNSNSLGGNGGYGGMLHNGWTNHLSHQHHLNHQLNSQSPSHSVQLKKSNMRHSSSTAMLSNGVGCSCESSPKNPNLSQLYSPNRSAQQHHHHWSVDQIEDNYHLHSPTPLYGAALKRSTGITALNETSAAVTPSAAPFTLGDHMTGFMFAPSAMDLLSTASCNSVVVPPSVGNAHQSSISHPHAHPHPHLGHYRHHSSSGVLRGAQLQAAFSSNLDQHHQNHFHQLHHPNHAQQHHQHPLFYQPSHLIGGVEPEMSANAFIFDPNVDVESFLNEVEKELDDNCYASAPPFMARNASSHLPPNLVDNGIYPHLSPHRYFKTTQHLNQSGSEQNYLGNHPRHQQLPQQQQQNGFSSTSTLVNNHNLNHSQSNLGQSKQQGTVYSSLNSSQAAVQQKMTSSNYSPLAQEQLTNSSSSSASLAGGNWRLKASTLDLASNSTATSNQTITNNGSPNHTLGGGSGTSHFPFPSTASMPLTNGELLRGISNGNGINSSSSNLNLSSTGNLMVAPSSPGESQRYKRLIVPSASRNLLDNFRAQVSHRVAAETDSQLRQVEAWFQEQVQASMGVRPNGLSGSMAPESSSDSSSFINGTGSHQQFQQQQQQQQHSSSILLSTADRRRFSADNVKQNNNSNNTSNSDLIYFG